MILSHNTLANYYQTNFSLMQHHKYSLSDIDGMIPWERDLYVKLLIEHLEKLKEEQEKREDLERKRNQNENELRKLLFTAQRFHVEESVKSILAFQKEKIEMVNDHFCTFFRCSSHSKPAKHEKSKNRI